MKKKILATTLLLNITGLVGTGILQPAQSIEVITNHPAKDVKAFKNFSSRGRDDSAVILVAVGAILAFGTTVSIAAKVLNLSKPSSRTADFLHTAGEDKPEAIEDFTTSGNKQIACAAYVEQAYISFRQGDAQGAIAQLNHAIDAHPQEASLYTERANFRRRNLGDRHLALEDYTQAINLHPDNALLYLWRSQLYNEIGDKLKAMTDYNTAIRLAPENTMYHFFQTNVTSVRR